MPSRPAVAAVLAITLTLAGTACRKAEAVRGTIAPPDVAEPPGDAVTTPSGLAFRVLVAGNGHARPSAESRVLVNYTGWTTDGQVIDGAPVGTEPAVIRVSDVIPGWQEGLRLMVEGEKRRFWIPAHLAYAGEPGKPQGMLVYDISLVRVVD
ncbi:MAG TPA: FKBP-type peptidyl-prolyl cis-trans isomerase [Vicinamibacterales bacterium]